MEILIVSACGLVANQYIRLHNKSARASSENTVEASNSDLQQQQQQQHQQNQRQQQQQQQPPVGTSAPVTPTSFAPLSIPQRHRSAPTPAPIPLGVRALKSDNTGGVEYDESQYNEQFSHPQDPNPNVSEKPWMRMANAPYKPKEEIVGEIPGPQDTFGWNMRSRIKKMEADFASSTVPVTSEKQFDRPVEQIATGNGSAVGFHIGAGTRYHKFVFNDQPTIESNGGPRGAFSGAGGSHVKGDYRTVTQRSSLQHESVGPPMSVGVSQSSAPLPSFAITPAHAETYRLDDHLAKGSRAPVQASASTKKVSFRKAHDENLDVLHTSLVTGGERFATGASGSRETKIHVPLNNDPVPTYDKRVVPNFKIAKASDYQDQQVTARQMMIPEMSQNVSAIRKDSRPPVSASTEYKKSAVSLDTSNVQCGAGVKGAALLPVEVSTDSFRKSSDGVVADKVAAVTTGAAARAVGSSSSSKSLFRTTHSLSEIVGTPFIRGAGTKRASNLEPLHEATDTHLSEVERSGLLRGLNKASTSNAQSSVRKEKSEQTQERGDVFKNSERTPVLVAPGPSGTNRTGAANRDTRGMISQRGLDDEDQVGLLRIGKASNTSTSGSGQRSNPSSTKSRKLAGVLNARMRSSAAMKKLLKNPYALPAASRASF